MSLDIESLSREDLNLLAKLAEQSERFDEMVKYMTRVAEEHPQLTVEERNLLSVAFKNVIGTRRVSWRIVSSIEKKEAEKQSDSVLAKIKLYRQQIEQELTEICGQILRLLDEKLIPAAEDGESKVFYAKMKGDYHRYLAEFLPEDQRGETSDKALAAYKQASEIAVQDLASTHPIRLGLALNFSVFYYEILQQPAAACHLAKQAFNEAIPELDMLSEESYKDSTLIMQLLRDNLTLWTSDMQSNDDDSSGDVQDDAGES